MFKTALFDCAINEKCCSVDEGRAFALFFCPLPGDLTAQESPPPGISFPRQKKKKSNAGGGAGRSWKSLCSFYPARLN